MALSEDSLRGVAEGVTSGSGWRETEDPFDGEGHVRDPLLIPGDAACIGPELYGRHPVLSEGEAESVWVDEGTSAGGISLTEEHPDSRTVPTIRIWESANFMD